MCVVGGWSYARTKLSGVIRIFAHIDSMLLALPCGSHTAIQLAVAELEGFAFTEG